MILKKTQNSKAAALALARRGFAVFPCKPRDKAPATAHGFKDASTDEAVVERLFGTGDYNVGIATGAASGVWVLDVEAEGIEDFDRLQQEHGKIPETVTSITGGGGRHYFFRSNGVEIKNRTKIGGMAIDVRGDGGYVVVPPSIHPSGNPYEWLNAPGSIQINDATSWLVDFVTGNGNALTSLTSVTSQPALTFNVGGSAVEDLATAPGVSQGERHNTALRLIGSAIARGLELRTVAEQAIEWSRRCTPPMDEDEVLTIVNDLSQRQGTKIETAIREEVESTPLPEPTEWPVLDEEAFYGIAGEIVRAIEPESEADPVAILVQLLVMFGNLIGRLSHFIVEGTSHHTNLFATLVGATARGRKGTSEGRVRQIIYVVDTDWVRKNIATGCASGEGIVWNVRDEIWGLKKGKEVLTDKGISDKRLLIIEPEFAAVLRVCRRETNTLSPTLRSAWDSGNLRTLAKNAPAKATDAHISIIGHITMEELRKSLTENDSFNGFANRFLWVAVHRSKLLPDGGQDLDLSPYAERLLGIVETAQSIERMHRDLAATALWRKIYAELANDDSTGLLAAVTSRAEAQVLRLSMMYALLDCSDTITIEHLRAALALWQYCQHSARLIFGNASGDPLTDKILETVRQHPEGIGRGELHSSVCKHKPAAAFIEILVRLRDAGKIEMRTVATAGRSAETWFPREREEREKREKRVSDPGLTSLTSLTSPGKAEMEEIVI